MQCEILDATLYLSISLIFSIHVNTVGLIRVSMVVDAI